jgi:RHS repeat-associated protein
VILGIPAHVEAQVYTPVFYYYHNDHLGSSHILSDRNGERVAWYEYTTFGASRWYDAPGVSVSNRYTGQIFDDDTGLYFYNSRYYDPQLARFIQPDTLVPGSTDPQSLNRYTYIGNNPLNGTDPNGHDFWSDVGGFFKAVFNAEASYWSSGKTWENVGIGFALGGWAGAGLGLTIGHAATEIGAGNGYLFGPDIGNDSAFAAAIAGAIAGAVYGVGFSGATTGQQIVIAASTAASVGSSSAAFAGDSELADVLGYVSIGISVVGSGLAAYFEKQGTVAYPRNGSQDVADYQDIGVGGILEGAGEAQMHADRTGYPWLSNPSNGPVTDVMENLFRKLFFGLGDSMGHQIGDIRARMQAGVSVHGFSAGSGILTFAALQGRLGNVLRLDLAASPMEYGIARWGAAVSHAQLMYRTSYFDISSVYAPSYNPLMFFSGFGAYRHSFINYY